MNLVAVLMLCLSIATQGLRTAAAPSALPAVGRLPTGATTPRGWLLRQLVIQAEGLSGHLTKFWPKVQHSAWFGGNAPFYSANNSCGDGPCPAANNISQSDLLHQEASYWLNGFVPLAVLLKNAGITELPPRGPGLPTIKPLEQAEHYVDYILSHTGPLSTCGAAAGGCVPAPEGWLGPYDLGLAGSMYWGSFPALLALLQFAEAGNTTQYNRTTGAMVGHFLAMRRQLQQGPTFCQQCSGTWPYPCFGPTSGSSLPPDGSCKHGIDLCGGDLTRQGLRMPLSAQPHDCEALCKKHNIGLKRGAPACTAFVFAVGNASSSPSSTTCYLKTSPKLPQNDCGHSSCRDGGTLCNMCAALIPPPDTCYNLSTVARGNPTGSISFQRWIDLAYALIWTINTPGASHGHEDELTDLLWMVQRQGQDWDRHFQQGHIGGTHNVNLAQGLKSAAVNYLASGGSATERAHYAALSKARVKLLDDSFGLPTGMFVGDEHLPPSADRNPGRGIETCGVVESMFSYAVMWQTHGDTAYADKVERIAFNALPAAFASPRGGDMMRTAILAHQWAHQYFQAVNEINAVPIPGFHGLPSPVYTYGINQFPCCTANFHQGWPKFSGNIFGLNQTQGYEGIVVGLWAPAAAETVHGHIEIKTEYPFGDNATVTVARPRAAGWGARRSKFLYLRVPGWATDAVITPQWNVRSKLQGDGINGTVQRLQLPTSSSLVCQVLIEFNPKIRLEADGLTSTEDGQKGSLSYSVHRGALMFSLPFDVTYTQTAHYYAESNDYNVTPSAPWAFALDTVDSMHFVDEGWVEGSAPFNKTASPRKAIDTDASFWPSYIVATARDVSKVWRVKPEGGWQPQVPPSSPVCANTSWCGPPTKILLVPHGGTALRIGTMPLSGK